MFTVAVALPASAPNEQTTVVVPEQVAVVYPTQTQQWIDRGFNDFMASALRDVIQEALRGLRSGVIALDGDHCVGKGL